MRDLAVLSILALAMACTDANVTQPESLVALDAATPGEPQLTTINGRFTAPKAGWKFQAQLVFTGPIAAGEMSMTPSGVMHVTGAINAFDIIGDLEGSNTFNGNYHIDTKTGRGGAINLHGTFELTSPGVGTFECGGSSFRIEGYLPPAYAFVQSGNMAGCNGTGAFEGMHMKGQFTNEGDPGSSTYDVWGVIW